MPRTVTSLCLAWIIICSSGCRLLFNFQPAHPLPPALPSAELDLGTLTNGVNQNTDAVQQLDAQVKISMNGLPTAISGTLLLERPDRLRLQAGLLGMSDLGVDIGSNDELFWIWTKTALPGQSPTILYSRHDQFMKSAAGRQLRLHPRFIVNALGLIRFESTQQHSGPHLEADKRLKIQSQITLDGQPMTRVVKINPKYGWIEQIALYDSNGYRIAYANASDHRYDEQNNVTLPRYVQLFVYPENGKPIELTIQLTRVQFNQLAVDPQRTWTMPTPADVQTIDLGAIESLDTGFPGQEDTGNSNNSPLAPRIGVHNGNTLPRNRGYTVTR